MFLWHTRLIRQPGLGLPCLEQIKKIGQTREKTTTPPAISSNRSAAIDQSNLSEQLIIATATVELPTSICHNRLQ
jgi:hypothetical protein